MELTKEQVETIKYNSENALMKHGYDITIVKLCADWLEMYNGLDFVEEDVCIGDVGIKVWIPKKE